MNIDTQHPNPEHANMANQESAEEPGTEPASDISVDVLQERIRELEEEVLEQKDRYLRSLADVENMRRRHERERGDLLKFGTEKLLQDLLPVLDSFEKAMQVAGQGPSDGLVEGVRMVHKQLLQTLEHHGLKTVEAQGQPFDPNVHQAIQRVETADVSAETVKDEFQKGYLLNGRLIRPSMVSVFVPATPG